MAAGLRFNGLPLEVGFSEISVQADCLCVIGFGADNRIIKVPEMVNDSISAYRDGVPLFPFLPVNTLEPGHIVAGYASIAVVLTTRTVSQVRTPIIQSIPVAVIDHWPVKAHNLPVHPNAGLSPIASAQPPYGVVSGQFILSPRSPTPLHQPFVIGCIHDRDLTLG
jgi:hypothetical protein